MLSVVCGGAKGCCLRSVGSGIFIAQVVLNNGAPKENNVGMNIVSFGAFISNENGLSYTGFITALPNWTL